MKHKNRSDRCNKTTDCMLMKQSIELSMGMFVMSQVVQFKGTLLTPATSRTFELKSYAH